jgi:hypothetical protein
MCRNKSKGSEINCSILIRWMDTYPYRERHYSKIWFALKVILQTQTLHFITGNQKMGYYEFF